jgi:hypothetical protein
MGGGRMGGHRESRRLSEYYIEEIDNQENWRWCRLEEEEKEGERKEVGERFFGLGQLARRRKNGRTQTTVT